MSISSFFYICGRITLNLSVIPLESLQNSLSLY